MPHNALAFRLYYLLGAMWMPSLMGMGSLGLVMRRAVVWVIFAILLIFGLVGSVLLFLAHVQPEALNALNGGPGVNVLASGAWLPFLIVLNTFGAMAVSVVALWSVWTTFRRQTPARFLLGNAVLALGILIISAAGTAARLGAPSLFWVTMLIGWCVTFIGYLLLTPWQAANPSADAM